MLTFHLGPLPKSRQSLQIDIVCVCWEITQGTQETYAHEKAASARHFRIRQVLKANVK